MRWYLKQSDSHASTMNDVTAAKSNVSNGNNSSIDSTTSTSTFITAFGDVVSTPSEDIIDEYSAFYEQAQLITGLFLYPAFCLFGLVGNCLTVIVLRDHKLRSVTSTLLVALSVSDGIKLVNDLFYFVVVLLLKTAPDYGALALGYMYPYAHYFFNASLCVTAWLTVSLAVERYILVCHVAHAKQWCNVVRARFSIGFVYLSMTIFSVPFGFRYRTIWTEVPDEGNDVTGQVNHSRYVPNITVTELWSNQEFTKTYSWIQNILRSIIPLLIISIQNILRSIIPLLSISIQYILRSIIPLLIISIQNILRSIIPLLIISIQNILRSIIPLLIISIQNILRSIIPLLIISTLNCFIVDALRRSSRHVISSSAPVAQQHQPSNASLVTRTLRFQRGEQRHVSPRNRRVTLMLVAVIVVFIVCVTPDAILSTVFGFGYYDESSYLIRGIREITDFLLLLNSACNFLLYCAFNSSFRNRFRSLVVRRFECCRCLATRLRSVLPVSTVITADQRRVTTANQFPLVQMISQSGVPLDLVKEESQPFVLSQVSGALN